MWIRWIRVDVTFKTVKMVTVFENSNQRILLFWEIKRTLRWVNLMLTFNITDFSNI